MLERLKNLIDKGREYIKDSFSTDGERMSALPPGVTAEELIREAKAYVDAIIVKDDSKND